MQTNAKKLVKIVSLSVLFIFVLGFAFFNSKDLIFGVKITNVNLKNNLNVTESAFEITGNAKNAKNLSLNGREISIDQKGNFDEYIAFLKGYNIVNITAKDKFGHVDEKNYHINH